MKKLSIGVIVAVILFGVWFEYFSCSGFVPETDGFVNVGACHCWKCKAQHHYDSITLPDGWKQGTLLTYRKTYPHQLCPKGGDLVFNGQTERAPYSDKESFYVHVCDKCSQTNKILNAYWPQYKREWRDAK